MPFPVELKFIQEADTQNLQSPWDGNQNGKRSIFGTMKQEKSMNLFQA
jgi:hypothetical protein